METYIKKKKKKKILLSLIYKNRDGLREGYLVWKIVFCTNIFRCFYQTYLMATSHDFIILFYSNFFTNNFFKKNFSESPVRFEKKNLAFYLSKITSQS